MTEIYKTLHDLNPPFMKEIFLRLAPPYILKSEQRLKVHRVKTSAYGLETASFQESQTGILWGIVLNNYQV